MPYTELQTVPAYEPAAWQNGRLTNSPEATKWSGQAAPPAIGTKVQVTVNGLGLAVVTGYFVTEGWLGLLVEFLEAPAWFLQQNNNSPKGHVFGAEFKVPAAELELPMQVNWAKASSPMERKRARAAGRTPAKAAPLLAFDNAQASLF